MQQCQSLTITELQKQFYMKMTPGRARPVVGAKNALHSWCGAYCKCQQYVLK